MKSAAGRAKTATKRPAAGASPLARAGARSRKVKPRVARAEDSMGQEDRAYAARIGAILRSARNALGMTRGQVAAACVARGSIVSDDTIGNYENGFVAAKITTLRTLSVVLGVPLVELVDARARPAAEAALDQERAKILVGIRGFPLSDLALVYSHIKTLTNTRRGENEAA